jgi:hypothetical protein
MRLFFNRSTRASLWLSPVPMLRKYGRYTGQRGGVKS